MRLGFLLDYRQRHISVDMDLVRQAEAFGYDSVWVSEAWGNDVVSIGAWILAQTEKIRFGTAIMQIPARAPTMAAMTAMTLDQLSGGRFILGLGVSGPQVAEGWYGQAYGKPLAKSREYIEIVRKVLAREAPLEHAGEHYDIPLLGEGSTGLGKPLKSILHGNPELPIYSASFTPGGIRSSAQIADGLIPIWMDPTRFDLFADDLERGFAATNGQRSLENFDICPFVFAGVFDDLEACRVPLRNVLALYVGGMGARDRNFYNDYVKRLGYEEAAVRIQDLYLDGRKDEAAAAVPDALIDDLCLIGPEARVRERLQVWKQAASQRQVDTMIIQAPDANTLRVIAEECL